MARSAVSLSVRVGGQRRGTSEASDPNFVANRLVQVLKDAADKKGIDAVIAALEANMDKIIAEVTRDAQNFGDAAARVMTKIQSPIGGSTTVSLDAIPRRSAVYSTDRMSTKLKGKTTVEWLALSAETRRNKRNRARLRGGRQSKTGPTTFFVDSGALKKVLDQYLGQAFALLVDPRIIVRRTKTGVNVTLSIMAQASGREKAGVTGDSFPGVNAPGTIAREESLFVRYLKRAGARDDKLSYKLGNPRGFQRPFLQNSLAFWISNRMPAVLEGSLRTALAKNLKKGK